MNRRQESTAYPAGGAAYYNAAGAQQLIANLRCGGKGDRLAWCFWSFHLYDERSEQKFETGETRRSFFFFIPLSLGSFVWHVHGNISGSTCATCDKGHLFKLIFVNDEVADLDS